MSHLREAVEKVVQAARAWGLRVTEDPRSLNPPTVFVSPDSVVRATSAQADVTLRAVLVAPGPANLDALRKLDDLEEQLTAALDAAGIPWLTARVGAFTSPSSGEELLAYELTLIVTTEV